VPFRGKRNESSYVVHVAQKISELKKITIEEVDEITTANAKKIFSF
jgi:TatD DNase family protein